MLNQISFIEKEPHKSETIYFNGIYYPTFMVKNSEHYFLYNRSVPASYGDEELQNARKQQLIDNGGAYFKFHDHSKHNSPIELLKWIKEKGFHLDKRYTAKILSDGKTFDFHGNLREISCAFFYRIFDKDMAKEIQEIISTIR